MTRLDPTLARDVARQLDRRRMRRRLLLWSALLALVAAAAMYLRCGDGFGLGGPGKGPGEGGEVRPVAGPKRCDLRVAKAGITVDGKPMLRDEAVAACKAAGGADVVVTGDAREGDWKDLRGALETAGVTEIAVHDRR
jgi:hypothetical protein